MIILEENIKWHLEAFASELFIHKQKYCTTTTISSTHLTDSISRES